MQDSDLNKKSKVCLASSYIEERNRDKINTTAQLITMTNEEVGLHTQTASDNDLTVCAANVVQKITS